MKLKIFASLAEDINNGWVWVPENVVGERSVVRLKNKSSSKIVYCEALQLGQNYMERYNTNHRTHPISDPTASIVMNEWYRKKLGVRETRTKIDVDLVKADHFWGHMRACLHHPQIVVRLAMELAILSVVLGAVGVYFGIYT